jgi:hypothetical protein
MKKNGILRAANLSYPLPYTVQYYDRFHTLTKQNYY